jgi:hypothetical protein
MKPPEVWRKLEEVWQNRSGSESNSFGETFFSLADKNKKTLISPLTLMKTAKQCLFTFCFVVVYVFVFVISKNS